MIVIPQKDAEQLEERGFLMEVEVLVTANGVRVVNVDRIRNIHVILHKIRLHVELTMTGIQYLLLPINLAKCIRRKKVRHVVLVQEVNLSVVKTMRHVV
jgi:hypothetical protein